MEESYNEKLETEEELKSEISKLQDPEYMARYAREKYLYSGSDEIIIKIEE
jgi:cell division protein FtsB